MLQEIIFNLGQNFKSGDEDILNSILDNFTTEAKNITNKTDVTDCKMEIMNATKTAYLQRGTEDVTDLNSPERSMKYVDPMDKLRIDLVKNGKRRIF